MRYFIGIIAHFVPDWQMKNAMLSCTRCRGYRTGVRICHQYDEALDIYEIDGKVSEVVSDNASNMANAFQIPDGEENGTEHDEDSDSFDENDVQNEVSEDLDVPIDMNYYSPEHIGYINVHCNCVSKIE